MYNFDTPLSFFYKKCTLFLCLFFIYIPANAKDALIFSTAKGALIQKISEQVLLEAYSNIGYKIKIEHVPAARSLLMSNNGELDGEVSRVEGIDKEFSNLVRIPVAINFIEGYSFAKNSKLTIPNWESLRQYSLVCVRGVKFIRLNLEKAKIDCNYVTTFIQAIKMLQLGRIDIAVLPKINGMAAIKEVKTAYVKIIGKPLIKMNLYHYLHKKNKEIIPIIRAALIKMEVNGRIRDIRKQYIENHALQ